MRGYLFSFQRVLSVSVASFLKALFLVLELAHSRAHILGLGCFSGLSQSLLAAFHKFRRLIPNARRSARQVPNQARFKKSSLLVFTFIGCNASLSEFSDENTPTALPAQRMQAFFREGISRSIACDVVVAGGSTAALTVGLTAARQGIKTCLLEPTDWPGGQLTAGGVPAVDLAWENVPGYAMSSVAKRPENLPGELYAWLKKMGNPGACWVSDSCFEPKNLLLKAIYPALNVLPNLLVFKNTVVKRVQTKIVGDRKQIVALEVIRRFPKPGVPWGGYDRNLSQDLPDWYSPYDSPRYNKENLTLFRPVGKLIVVDATELGEVMVLAGATYLQGLDAHDGALQPGDELCGQTFTFPFVMRYRDAWVIDDLPPALPDHPEQYSFEGYEWNKIWRYRRLKGVGLAPHIGELSSQNWRLGNDYAHGPLFKSMAAAALERSHWQGGIDLYALDAAERQAYGWFRWFREKMPFNKGLHLELDRTVYGTGHGLSKFPYLRESRRSIGVGNFILKQSDLVNDGSGLTAKRFIDRVAIGLYPADIHPRMNCSLAPFLLPRWHAYPFYLPLRALTNRDVSNLLVAGKTMAQSFEANSATRVHPVEFSGGIAAGAAASTMIQKGIGDNVRLLFYTKEVQAIAKQYTPIDWTIYGKKYPSVDERLLPVDVVYCPLGAALDSTLGLCADSVDAYGPFPEAMVKACVQKGGGQACTAKKLVDAEDHPYSVARWGKAFTQRLRPKGFCMPGTHRDQVYTEFCVEDAADSASGKKEIYGPFSMSWVRHCYDLTGEDICFQSRWPYELFLKVQSPF